MSNENHQVLSYSQIKKRGFHAKYIAICKTKILQPIPEVKLKHHNFQLLDFHADRIKANDWMAICGALRNDRTLKIISIKLRKNDEAVLENVDTLKKSKTLTSVPVIYSKFLLSQFTDSLENMLTFNKVLEILALEGFPFGGWYMMALAKGLYSNHSIKVLSLARSNIGDDGCETLCSNIKHLSNIETLNLSHCNLGIKGAESVKEMIRFQKIHRFSQAWIHSLRYQSIDKRAFGGVRKILLNNNPQIGDEGLKFITTELKEDVFINCLEMQNCGLTDEGAEDIISCLNVNRTLLTFNISNNLDISDHMYRIIETRIGTEDNESCDSTDSKASEKKITKSQLVEKVKFLEQQLDFEISKRKEAENVINDQRLQIIEDQKQIAEIENREYSPPEGFTLIPNNELQKLVILSQGSITRTSASNIAVRLRRRRRNPIKKVQSLVVENPINKVKTTLSEACFKKSSSNKKKPFIERNIGDSIKNTPQSLTQKPSDEDIEMLQMLINTTQKTDFDILSVFSQSIKATCDDHDSENEEANF